MSYQQAPEAARVGIAALGRLDPDLATIEAVAGPLPWRERASGFPGLLQAIVGQQISSQAAAAIWRLLAATPGALDPNGMLRLADTDLRAAGLSRPKMEHARALARAFADGSLSAEAIAARDDREAVALIASVRGMGAWSAEVYLLFALGRQDVFPAGDVALAGAAMRLKRLDVRPGPAALRGMAEQWRPWRGLAARLLWHHWRHLTGRRAFDDYATHNETVP